MQTELHEDCPFCQRVNRKQYELTALLSVVSFVPKNPVTRGHMLFVPKMHVTDALSSPWLTGRVFMTAARYAQELRDEHPDFECNLITSAGASATQTIEHLHVHVVPRRPTDGLRLPWSDRET